jgi:hypothetical protein
VRNAFRRLWIQAVVDIVKVDEGEMLNVEVGKVQRARIIDGLPKSGSA